ncbi:DUF4163 domain-containing protein [Cohnella endophytica]|uniref:DUF4163 domain-containing protein n=1 Tax=Cohnella endophytica TaxID=2419778 RepID=A0A494XPP0_9BACL|nr:DUF4163 domain-containing protein [Cohnella endophytica]RKP50034.1 DUF4163 domain-containing protein [Cohnella endophytica]
MESTKRKMGTKSLIALACAAAIAATPLFSPARYASAATPYKIINQAIEVQGARSDIAALNAYNTTYIAIRSLNKSIGLNTQWDKSKNTVTVEGRGRTIVFDLGKGTASLNGQADYRLMPIVQNNTTYVPLRYLLEQMGYGVSYDGASKRIGIEAIAENDLKISNVTIKEEKAKKSIVVNYPQLSGGANADAEKKINALLKSEAESNLKAGRKSLDEALGDGTYVPENPLAFEGSYTITYNEKGKLSLFVDYYIYTGGAHGSVARVPYTFDLSTGDRISLKEAAGNNAKYVSIINSYILGQIKARGIGLLTPFKTIEPDRDYFLKHNGIVVYFGQYEYTPYAEGMPEFEVPFKNFQ